MSLITLITLVVRTGFSRNQLDESQREKSV